jgi:hypothetical protein
MPAGEAAPKLSQCAGAVLATAVEADAAAVEALDPLALVVAPGAEGLKAIAAHRARLGIAEPLALERPLDAKEAIAWAPKEPAAPNRFVVRAAEAERRTGQRRSLEASLSEARSFYFRGPEGKLNLRAQSLALFLQIAMGVDEDTWMFHLRQGDYSRWLRDALEEPTLAAEVAAIEAQDSSAASSRSQVRSVIEGHVASNARERLSTQPASPAVTH